MVKLPYKLHEWLAERVSWVQYPPPRIRQVLPDLPRTYQPRSSRVFLWAIVPLPIVVALPDLWAPSIILFGLAYYRFLKSR